jgi:hypothetical protein
VGTAFFVGGAFFVGATVLVAEAAFADADFFVGTAALAAGGRDAGTFFTAVALLAGLIVSSFPAIEVTGALTQSRRGSG